MNQKFFGQNDYMRIFRKKKPHHQKKGQICKGQVETQEEKKY